MGCKPQTTVIAQLWRGFATPQTAQNRDDRAARDLFSVALKATTVLSMLYRLGIKPSYSRPRVSDDDAYAELLLRTTKYRPEFPAKGFATLDEARAWATEFVRGYKVENHHSGIR